VLGLGATITTNKRKIEADKFFKGLYETALEPGELLTAVRIPALSKLARSAYVKFCPRSAEDRALIGVAAHLVMANNNRRCDDIKVALAGAAPTPMRAYQGETVLRGEPLTDSGIRACAEAAAAESDPLSDLMGSADYRRQMIRVWLLRLLRSLRDGTPLPT